MNERVRAYFELLRFPAVFTAIADVMMGYLVTHGDLRPVHVFALLAVASACLYLAGMVLNDVFDAEVDALERPHRPIPSGRITRRAGASLASCLVIAGIGFAGTASYIAGHWIPVLVATLLASCIVLYDAVVKATPVAPIAMGGCRFLNVLLGMSCATSSRWPLGPDWESFQIAIALGVGTYIAGLTWFATGESRTPNRSRMLFGMLTMLFGFLLLAQSGLMNLRPADSLTESERWPLMWFAIAAIVLGRCSWATWRLEPRTTQIAVRNAIRSVIVIDAALALGFGGAAWGWSILALLLPMLLLERWANTT